MGGRTSAKYWFPSNVNFTVCGTVSIRHLSKHSHTTLSHFEHQYPRLPTRSFTWTIAGGRLFRRMPKSRPWQRGQKFGLPSSSVEIGTRLKASFTTMKAGSRWCTPRLSDIDGIGYVLMTGGDQMTQPSRSHAQYPPYSTCRCKHTLD